MKNSETAALRILLSKATPRFALPTGKRSVREGIAPGAISSHCLLKISEEAGESHFKLVRSSKA